MIIITLSHQRSQHCLSPFTWKRVKICEKNLINDKTKLFSFLNNTLLMKAIKFNQSQYKYHEQLVLHPILT